MLNTMVLPGSPDQPAKAQRQLFSKLSEIAGTPERARSALRTLQTEEIIRPASSDNLEGAWQLDHDYLARSVLAEARQADRLGTTLRDGLARYRAAEGIRKRWSALLPIAAQTHLLWGKLRGRLR